MGGRAVKITTTMRDLLVRYARRAPGEGHGIRVSTRRLADDVRKLHAAGLIEPYPERQVYRLTVRGRVTLREICDHPFRPESPDRCGACGAPQGGR